MRGLYLNLWFLNLLETELMNGIENRGGGTPSLLLIVIMVIVSFYFKGLLFKDLNLL